MVKLLKCTLKTRTYLYQTVKIMPADILVTPGPVFHLLLGKSSDYAQPITGQVTEVTCPVIGRAQPELTQSKRQKTDPGVRASACIVLT